MRSRVVVAVAGVALVATGSVGGAVTPNVGIAGARIGMTEAQLQAAIGKPRTVRRSGKNAELAYATVTVVMVGGKALGMTTTSRSEKVVGGVGVGTAETVLRAKVAGLTCVVSFGTRVCNLLRPNHKTGQAFTEFFVEAGRVSRISIRTGAPLVGS